MGNQTFQSKGVVFIRRISLVAGILILEGLMRGELARAADQGVGCETDRCQINQQRTSSQLLPAQTSTGPRTSPFDPPEASDTEFIVDQAPGLDTGCTFRSGGPLEFDIEVARYVGPVDTEGKLVDPAGLVAAGVVSPTATLILPAFDVDEFGGPPPEVDVISLNGTQLGTLTGDNNIWALNEFDVDIANLRFPDRAPLGSTPTPAMNHVRIDIDTASGPVENWCTSIDWAALGLKAVSPVILVHGNNSDAGFWDRHGFSGALATAKIPFDGCGAVCQNPINLPTSFVAANGATLGMLIPDIVKSFGADSYHIVAHSKGGLDSREYLTNYQPKDLTLISHTTLSTPHNGSILADLAVLNNIAVQTADKVRFSGFPTFTQTLTDKLGIDNGTRNLTTAFTAAFNLQNVGALPAADYNQVGADADRNGSALIDTEAEVAALRLDSSDLPGPTFLATGIVNIMYQILRNNRAITATTTQERTFLNKPIVVVTISAVPSTQPNQNDVLVTTASARGVGSIQARSTNSALFVGANGRNHSDVSDDGVAATVIPWLISAERSRGDLK
jgi:triacylglycerol lipase